MRVDVAGPRLDELGLQIGAEDLEEQLADLADATPRPNAMFTASPTSSSQAAAATIPRAVSSTQVKSRVC